MGDNEEDEEADEGCYGELLSSPLPLMAACLPTGIAADIISTGPRQGEWGMGMGAPIAVLAIGDNGGDSRDGGGGTGASADDPIEVW